MSNARVLAEMSELNQIKAELKRLRDLMEPLKKRQKQIEANMQQHMTRTGERGLKKMIDPRTNTQIELVEKKTRERLKKEEKETMAIQFLQQMGVTNPRRAFAALQDVMKGEEQTVQTLQVKDALTGKKK